MSKDVPNHAVVRIGGWTPVDRDVRLVRMLDRDKV